MIVVINAGGSGTRLWPLSTQEYPKHLLKLAGSGSLLQNTLERAKLITSLDKIYITTQASHADVLLEQVPEVPPDHIIVEPALRDTMPCILNALQIVSIQQGTSEAISFIHADHHIADGERFAEDVLLAGRVATESKRIVLVGIEPTGPDIKYGYIQKGQLFDAESNIFNVKSFKEKPEYEVAKEYIASGKYVWNAGYFVASYEVFLEAIANNADKFWLGALKKLESVTSQAERDKVYVDFPKEAIDTALMERSQDLLIVPSSFDWADVGTFDDVYKIAPKDTSGNVVVGGTVELLNVQNSYVRNEENRPVAVMGLDNIIVVNTPTGVLVMPADHSQKVKEVVNKLKNQNVT